MLSISLISLSTFDGITDQDCHFPSALNFRNLKRVFGNIRSLSEKYLFISPNVIYIKKKDTFWIANETFNVSVIGRQRVYKSKYAQANEQRMNTTNAQN